MDIKQIPDEELEDVSGGKIFKMPVVPLQSPGDKILQISGDETDPIPEVIEPVADIPEGYTP